MKISEIKFEEYRAIPGMLYAVVEFPNGKEMIVYKGNFVKEYEVADCEDGIPKHMPLEMSEEKLQAYMDWMDEFEPPDPE